MVSVKQKVPVIQDIHDIHPEIDPETSLTQGMTQSQISFRETKHTSNFSRDAVSNRSGLQKQAISTEIQPMRQNSTKSCSSSVLQVSQRSPRDQDIQNSTDVSVQSFRDTETDPETHSKVNNLISKKFQVSQFQRCSRILPKEGGNSSTASNRRISIPAVLQTSQCRRIISMQRSSRKRNIWQVEIKF